MRFYEVLLRNILSQRTFRNQQSTGLFGWYIYCNRALVFVNNKREDNLNYCRKIALNHLFALFFCPKPRKTAVNLRIVPKTIDIPLFRAIMARFLQIVSMEHNSNEIVPSKKRRDDPSLEAN